MALIALRKAALEDADLLLRWRNDPEIVALGSSGKTVTRDEHLAWMRQVVEGSSTALYLVTCDGTPVGQLRFDRRDASTVEVSIYLQAQHRKRGAGREALLLGCQRAFADSAISAISARVLRSNAASQAFFRAGGFADASASGQELGFLLRRPPNVPHNRLTTGSEEAAAVADVARSGYWAGKERVAALERRFADMTGMAHAICVASGSSALRLALMALGVSDGDAVAMPAYCCVALPNAALALGARPVLVDVDASDWNMNASAGLAAARSAGCRAVVTVNTFGSPASIPVDASIPWIEDASHGFRSGNGANPASDPSMVVASLYATKMIAAGEGGVILTRSGDMAAYLRDWRDYTDRTAHRLRFNDKMNDLEAALALCQLDRLPQMIESRLKLASRYHEVLAPIAASTPAFTLPRWSKDRVWYRYAIFTETAVTKPLVEKMRAFGVQAEHPVEDWRSGSEGACPIADRGYTQLVSLPLYPAMTGQEQDLVVRALKNALDEIAHG